MSKEYKTKRQALRSLALSRKQELMQGDLAGFRNIHEYHGGIYDQTDHVSPWSRSAQNVDAKCLFLLKDWSSHEVLNASEVHPERIALGHDPERPTNRNLKHLVRHFLGVEICDLYVTNLFPFIKQGKISGAISRRATAFAATKYALPQIEIVGPALVVCTGLEPFNALRTSVGLNPVSRLRDALNETFTCCNAQVRVVPHPSRKHFERDAIYWQRIAERFHVEA